MCFASRMWCDGKRENHEAQCVVVHNMLFRTFKPVSLIPGIKTELVSINIKTYIQHDKQNASQLQLCVPLVRRFYGKMSSKTSTRYMTLQLTKKNSWCTLRRVDQRTYSIVATSLSATETISISTLVTDSKYRCCFFTFDYASTFG